MASENYSRCCIMGSFHYRVTPIVKFKIFKSPGRKHELWMSTSMGRMCIYPQARPQHICVGVNPCMKAGPSGGTEALVHADLPLNHSPSCPEDASYFFKTRSYLSSPTLPGVFSHDKNYLHIIYIYRFAAFPSAKDIFRDSVFPYPSPTSSHLEERNFRFHFPFTCVSSSPLALPRESHCL